MAMICDNIARIKEDISLICQRLGRDPYQITIVGITKYAAANAIQQALNAGLIHIGENRVQEAAHTYCSLKHDPSGVVKHMVGHLQSNKVKSALKIFDIIQSVDSFKIARAIDQCAAARGVPAKIMIQVNASREGQKFGIAPDEAMSLLADSASLEYVNVVGIMAIGPLTDDAQALRRCFRDVKRLYDRAAQEYTGHQRICMQYLSMGMTDDYAIAIEEGSNMVRIGRGIFSNE